MRRWSGGAGCVSVGDTHSRVALLPTFRRLDYRSTPAHRAHHRSRHIAGRCLARPRWITGSHSRNLRDGAAALRRRRALARRRIWWQRSRHPDHAARRRSLFGRASNTLSGLDVGFPARFDRAGLNANLPHHHRRSAGCAERSSARCRAGVVAAARATARISIRDAAVRGVPGQATNRGYVTFTRPSAT